jgi:hypothetical protein
MTRAELRNPRHIRLALIALACVALAVVLSGSADAKKKRKQSIAGTYSAITDDYGGYTVAINVSRSGVVSPFQLQMIIYGKNCGGTTRVASVPVPIALKRVNRSKLEGEYHGMDSNGVDRLGVQLKLDATRRILHGTVKTERVVGVNPADEYDWPCIGQTSFDAKRGK